MYCKALDVTRQAYYDYLDRKSKPWKYEPLAKEMMKIHNEDTYNDTYGRERMYIALKLKSEAGEISVHIPSESTVRNVMEHIGLIHKPRRRLCLKLVESRQIPIPVENIDKRSNNSFMNNFIFRKTNRFSCETFDSCS